MSKRRLWRPRKSQGRFREGSRGGFRARIMKRKMSWLREGYGETYRKQKAYSGGKQGRCSKCLATVQPIDRGKNYLSWGTKGMTRVR